ANIAVDMIAQSVGTGGRAAIGFTVLNTDLDKTKKTLAPIVAELGASLDESGKVSKVSVVGAGMRAVSGVAERMFQALAAEGGNMKLFTTGNTKLTGPVEEVGRDGGNAGVPPGSTVSRASRSRRRTWRRARRSAAARRCGRS